MLTPRRTLSLALLLGLILTGSQPAQAAKRVPYREQALTEYTTKLAAQLGVKDPNELVRRVAIKLPGRKAERVCVPVLPESIGDFCDRFTADKGCFLWRQVPGNARNIDYNHPMISLGQGKELKYFGNGFADLGADLRNHAAGGYCMVVEPPDMGFVEKFWTKFHPSSQQQFQQAYGGGYPKGDCMWWLLNAKGSENSWLAHDLGVSRSTSSQNFFRKVLHAGNDRVGPVGVCVGSLQEFHDLAAAGKLLGDGPNAGAAEAIRE